MLSFIGTVLHACLGLTKTQVLKEKRSHQKEMKRCDGSYAVINHLNDVIVPIQRSLRAKLKVVHVSHILSHTTGKSHCCGISQTERIEIT